MEVDILKHIQVSFYQTFRKEKLWTKRVDSLLKLNESYLARVYEQHKDIDKKVLTQKTAIRTIMEKMFGIEESVARKIFAKSKMLVLNERTQSDAYSKLRFTEFLELIGRIADHALTVDKQTELDFEGYLQLVIEQLLAKAGLQRKILALQQDENNDEES